MNMTRIIAFAAVIAILLSGTVRAESDLVAYAVKAHLQEMGFQVTAVQVEKDHTGNTRYFFTGTAANGDGISGGATVQLPESPGTTDINESVVSVLSGMMVTRQIAGSRCVVEAEYYDAVQDSDDSEPARCHGFTAKRAPVTRWACGGEKLACPRS